MSQAEFLYMLWPFGGAYVEASDSGTGCKLVCDRCPTIIDTDDPHYFNIDALCQYCRRGL